MFDLETMTMTQPYVLFTVREASSAFETKQKRVVYFPPSYRTHVLVCRVTVVVDLKIISQPLRVALINKSVCFPRRVLARVQVIKYDRLPHTHDRVKSKRYCWNVRNARCVRTPNAHARPRPTRSSEYNRKGWKRARIQHTSVHITLLRRYRMGRWYLYKT